MKVLTSSSLSSFRDCPRKHFYGYDLKRVPISEPAPLAFGKLAHSALEAWWKDGPEAAVAWLVEHAGEMEQVDAAKIAALLKHYDPPRDRFKVLAVEENFEMKIESPVGGRSFYGYRLAGKVDVLVEDKATGKPWIVDHKTTSSTILGFERYWQGLQVDGQMANYCLAFNAQGFIYDVIKKPTIKLKESIAQTDPEGNPIFLLPGGELALKKDGSHYKSCPKGAKAQKRPETVDEYQARIEASITEDPEPWYQWREHPKLEDDMHEARMDLWQQVEMYRACANDGRFPRNSNACVNRYGTCQYIRVCTDQASIEDDAVFRTKEAVNEEL